MMIKDDDEDEKSLPLFLLLIEVPDGDPGPAE